MINQNRQIKDSAIKVMAIIGVVAVLSLGGFLTIAVITKVPTVFSNLSAQAVSITSRFISAERLVVEADNKNPENGDTVTLSFEHINKKEDGSYSFFYECREGVHFKRNGEIIFCNTPYSFINTDNTIVFDVFSSEETKINVPLSINFVKNNSDRISERGEFKLSINGDNGSITDGGTILLTDNRDDGSRSNTSTQVNRRPGERVEETFLFNDPNNTNTSRFSDPNGRVDLRPKIIAVGKVDRNTNEFIATSTVSMADRGAVKFEVENIGTKVSPSWTFNVVVPTFPAFIYHSTGQQPLLPGDRIEYIIGFDSIRNDDEPNNIIVNIDPISSIYESNEDNNIVKRELKAI